MSDGLVPDVEAFHLETVRAYACFLTKLVEIELSEKIRLGGLRLLPRSLLQGTQARSRFSKEWEPPLLCGNKWSRVSFFAGRARWHHQHCDP